MCKADLDTLVARFLKEGGKINKYYLSKSNKGPSLVYLNGWFSGQNVSDAITKAFTARSSPHVEDLEAS